MSGPVELLHFRCGCLLIAVPATDEAPVGWRRAFCVAHGEDLEVVDVQTEGVEPEREIALGERPSGATGRVAAVTLGVSFGQASR